MRVKTDERRQSIIDAAIEVFRAEGYERASMSLIAARLGGSKTTLYGYFASKEELFAAAMGEALNRQAEKDIGALDPAEPDVMLALLKFGAAYNRLVTSEDALAVTRVNWSGATADSPVAEKIPCQFAVSTQSARVARDVARSSSMTSGSITGSPGTVIPSARIDAIAA